MRTEIETVGGAKWRLRLAGFGAALYSIKADGLQFRCYVAPNGRAYLYHRTFEDLLRCDSREIAAQTALAAAHDIRMRGY